MINGIKIRTGVDREEFDNNPDVLNLVNGLLNIHTLELSKPTPEYLSLERIPIRYDPSARCTKIVRFLNDALPEWKDRLTALEFIGYCIYRTAKYEKALLLVGEGDNGKGTFLKLIEGAVGTKNASHVSLQDMNEDRFSMAGLFGKLVNTFADLPAEKLKFTGYFKMLVSGNIIRTQSYLDY